MNPLSLQGLTPRLGTSLQLAFVYPDWLKERMSEACNVSFAIMMWVFLSICQLIELFGIVQRQSGFSNWKLFCIPRHFSNMRACLWEN